jgi:lipoprotein-releasing system ATP-binding protein
MSGKKILESVAVNKFFDDPVKFQVLTDVSFSIEQGSFVSVVGKSGCGKSTLLYILSTMDTDYEGEVILDNEPLHNKTSLELAYVRNAKIGFVFQFHYLLEEFNVLKNVMIPGMKLGRLTTEELEHRATDLLKLLGVGEQILKSPNQLSGGQKQRVSIARALINEPLIIMGDEPTGNLDKKNSDLVFEIFQNLCKEKKQTLLIVTHDQDFANRCDRIIEMNDGRIVSKLQT